MRHVGNSADGAQLSALGLHRDVVKEGRGEGCQSKHSAFDLG